MNREIKFRAWSEKLRKMFYGEEIDLYGMPLKGRVRTIQNGYDVETVTLMQYSGIFADNGLEVCEGDFISPLTPGGHIYIIKFEHGEFCLYSCWGHWGSLSRARDTFNGLEVKMNVIGNYFENHDMILDIII